MPRATAIVAVRYPEDRKDPKSLDRADTRITPDLGVDRSAELATLADLEVDLRIHYEAQHALHLKYASEVRRIAGLKVLPANFMPSLAEFIGGCRSVTLRVVPTHGEGRALLTAMAKRLRAELRQLGRAIDATAWPRADLEHELLDDGDSLRQWREDDERRLACINALLEKSERREQASRHVQAARAKDLMAAYIAGLLHGCGIRPTTATNSVYMQLLEWALDHADPKEPGDLKEIGAKGREIWLNPGVRLENGT